MSGTTNVSFAPLSDTKEADWELGQVLSAYMLCATLWLLFSTAIGVLLALKFIYPDMGSIPALSFGRLRQIHTNDTFYAWASPALVGLALYIAARSSGTRLYSVRLAWIALFLFNLAAIAGTVAVDLGASYGNQEYREWLWWIRIILALAMIATAWNLVATVARRESDDIYLSNWYTMAAVLWVIVITLVALLPWYQYGLGQVAVAGFFMHNAVGMWFTPLVLGVAYYALPKTLNRPIYSYSLGILAFWTNLAFYPLLGAHHFLFSPLPWWLQTTAIVASVAMVVPVLSGSSNFLLTMRGQQDWIYRSPAVFIGIAAIGYLLGSLQGTVEALRTMQRVWHLTNFTVGHSHLTMYVFVTFGIWGGAYALLPHATGKRPYNLAMGIHFWLALIGVVIYIVALSIGGTLQGLSWIAGAPFIQSVVEQGVYWQWRAVGGILMFLGHLVFAFNVWTMTYRRAPATEAAAPSEAAPA